MSNTRSKSKHETIRGAQETEEDAVLKGGEMVKHLARNNHHKTKSPAQSIC